MNFIINIFNTFLYKPLFNALIFLYEYLPGHDFGMAIIVLTVIIRLILYPLMVQAIKSQKAMAELQPKLQEIQKKYKNDKEGQARETMELYKREKINPFGGCLPLLIQFPILIALYQVFLKGIQGQEASLLYSFIPRPETIKPFFLGIIDLSQSTTVKIDGASHLIWINIILVILVGAAQFVQTKMITPKTSGTGDKSNQMDQFSGMLQKQMLYLMPIFTIFILWRLPAALGLYWLATSLFSILQQYLIYRTKKSDSSSAATA